MNKFAEEHNITLWFSDPDELNKNAIVERVNRTIAQLLNKVRIAKKNYDWPKYLDNVIFNYNNTYHKTIKEKPIDVFEGKVDSQQEHKIVKSDFKVNDLVRIIRKKKVFDKGDQL